MGFVPRGENMSDTNIDEQSVAEESAIKEATKAEELSTGEESKPEPDEAIAEEKTAMKEAQVTTGASDDSTAEDQTIDAAQTEAIIDAQPSTPAEVAAIHTDKPVKKSKAKSANKITKIPKKRSAKYQSVADKADLKKTHSLADALSTVKELSYSKFDGTVELHSRLLPTKKGDTIQLRGMIKLPSGSPKTKTIAVATDALIEEIQKGKIDFDILLTTPDMMPKLARVAKVLGPKGKMPSPKSGTITTDIEKTKAELSGGTTEYKTDAQGNLHIAIGKVSWTVEQLEANAQAVIGILPKRNIATLSVSATMSPSVKVEVER